MRHQRIQASQASPVLCRRRAPRWRLWSWRVCQWM